MDKDFVRKVGLSLSRSAAKGDESAVAKWATRALVEVNGLPEEPPVVVDAPPEPDTTPPYTRSTMIFGPWVFAWLKANFEDPYSLVPALVSAKAKEQGVLAAVTAAQLLGYPNAPFAEADFSCYTSFSAESTEDGFISRVWINGVLVAEEKNVDAFALALAHGIEG